MGSLDDRLIARLDDLCAAHAVSGHEAALAAKIRREASDYADEVSTDPLGNVIARMRADGPKVMVTAHLDEIGLMVRHIDERGFLFFAPVGGHRAQNLFARACTVKTDDGRLLPGLINHMRPGRPEGIENLPDLDEFFIDVGASTLEEAEGMGLEIGNTVSLEYGFSRLGGNRLMGKALDDRALVLIQLEAMRRLADGKRAAPGGLPDLYFVFTTQEEVGARGAKTAAHETITRLGAGPAIKVMDRLANSQMGLIADPRVVRDMKSIATGHGIPYQLEVFMAGSTDAATMHLEREGAASGAILLPTRYVHAHEVISERDVLGMTELLLRYLESLGLRLHSNAWR